MAYITKLVATMAIHLSYTVRFACDPVAANKYLQAKRQIWKELFGECAPW